MKASRRRFLKCSAWVASGLTVLGIGTYRAMPPLPTFGVTKEGDMLTWVQLLPSGQIRFYLPRAELGQGVSTGLSQVVAEEMNVPLARVECHYQSTAVMAPCQMTAGSHSIENYWELTARSAASLRYALQSRAALMLDVAENELALELGGFIGPNGQSLSYEQLLQDDEASVQPALEDSTVELLSQRPAAALRVVGREVEPVNVRRIVTGTETYSRDVHLPGMRYGIMARPPQLGAELLGFNRVAAMAVTGVLEVVELDESLGLVALTPMAASKGLEALAAQWSVLSDSQVAKIQQSLDVDAFIAAGKLDHVASKKGSLQAGGALAAQTLSLRYDSPMVAHAAMEPRSGVASWHKNESGKEVCEVWTGSQDPWLVQAAVARQLGVAQSRVIVHNQRVGGAFGGRLLCQASIEAACLSHAVSEPVKVQWSREDEFSYNYVGPQYSTRINAGLDARGRISHWHHRAVGAPILMSSLFVPPILHKVANVIPDPGTKRGILMPYDIQHHRVEFADERVPMPSGPWRGLGAAPNTYAVECAMDELAVAAGQNPLNFRLKHTDNPRLIECLQRLQRHVGQDIDSMGIAATIYDEVTYLAMAAQVELHNSKPRVTRMICVHDCGRVISPDQVRAQIEGNMVWGIGMALSETFVLNNGFAETRNFDRYLLPRQVDVPDFTIELVESNLPVSGAAEASLAPAAAAIANAVYAVTKQRVRELPIKNLAEV